MFDTPEIPVVLSECQRVLQYLNRLQEYKLINNLSSLKPEARLRVCLLQEDVCQLQTKPVDVVLAMNFSYQLLMTREKLGGYFGRVRKSLVKDGVLFMDAFGGYDAYREIKEKTAICAAISISIFRTAQD